MAGTRMSRSSSSSLQPLIVVFASSSLLLLLLLSLLSSSLVAVQALRAHDHDQGIISVGGLQRSLLTVAADSSSIDCGAACSARCQLSSRPNLCHRACGTCCSRCQCIPSGTSGHLEECACYANMTTRGDKRKCP